MSLPYILYTKGDRKFIKELNILTILQILFVTVADGAPPTKAANQLAGLVITCTLLFVV